METVWDFIFLGSKITVDGNCSHEIKRCLLLGRKPMTNLDSILKSSNIILPTKVRLLKAMVFPVVMYGCESWTIKKAECQRIDAFELWCWRRLLRVPWTAEINPVNPNGNQAWISIGRTDAEAEAPILGHLVWRANSLEKTLMLGKTEGDDRGRDGWMASLTQRTWVWTNSGRQWRTGKSGMLQPTGLQRIRHDWVTKQQHWARN